MGGKRSKTGRLLEFKSLAFKLAKMSKTEVVPCVIFTNKPILSKGQSWFSPRPVNFVNIDILDVLDSNSTAQKLSDEAFNVISKRLEIYRKNLDTKDNVVK